MFTNIVVGIDGSETSHEALKLACDLAGKYGAALHLVHTPQPQTVAFAMGAVAGYHAVTTMPDPEEVREAAARVLSAGLDIAHAAGQTITSTHDAPGDPADEILSCAETCKAELIVTGRRGLGSVSALLQGSTSQKLSHHAKCALLTVA